MSAVVDRVDDGTSGGDQIAAGRATVVLQILLVVGVMVVPVLALGACSEAAPRWLAQLVSLAILPAAAVSAWLVMRAEGLGWRGLGMGRPHSWVATSGLGLATGVGVLLAARCVITPLVVHLFGQYFDPAIFDPLRGNLGALLVNVVLISVLHAALCEEIVFRGFLLQRLERLLGGGPLALALAVVAQALLFGLAHLDRGAGAAAATTAGGILFAIAFLTLRRSLWVVIIGHAVVNITSFTLMYFGMHRLLIPG